MPGTLTPDEWAAVDSYEAFVSFLNSLAVDYDADALDERWAHGTPGAWMEACAAWLGAGAPVVYGIPLDELARDSPWQALAFILAASRTYE